MDKRTISREAVRRVLKDYWRQYSAHPWSALLAFSLPAVGTIFVFFVPPLILARIVNSLVANKDVSLGSVGTLVALLGALWFFGEILWRIGMHVLIKLETKGLNALNKEAFLRLEDRDYDFYANNFVGSLTKKALGYARGFETFTDTLCFNILTNIFPIIFAIVILWRYSPWIPTILVACVVLAFSIGIPIVRRRSKLVALRHEASSKMAGRLSDSMTNMLAIKSFARETWESDSYGTYVDEYSRRFKQTGDYQNLRFDMAMSPVYVGANVIGLVSAIFFTHLLGLEAGAMIVVFTYYSQITRIFWETNRIYRNIESSVSEAAEFTQLLIDPPAIRDAAGASALIVSDAKVEFEGVGFAYDDGGKEEGLFLDDFNLKIAAHQKVGLVGPSGGGKTTITKLLLRFVDVSQGRIAIDSQDIKAVTQASLREAISYVPQEPLLFHRSLHDNIAYGSANASREDVVRAARLARADDFIQTLPHGYETLVGERGIKLSGGQRQRVAIARAILKNSPILVLDEATSSLDSESEKYIQEGLQELMKGKTALVIAHRLSTIRHLDRIIVLEQGRIVQDGTHEELLKEKGGLYARLWSHQSGEFLED